MAIAASGGARLGLTKEQTKVCLATPTLQLHKLKSIQRDEEFIKKYLKAVHDALGDRENEVITLRTVATSPAQQGHGYASTLVRTVTDIVRLIICALVCRKLNIVITRLMPKAALHLLSQVTLSILRSMNLWVL